LLEQTVHISLVAPAIQTMRISGQVSVARSARRLTFPVACPVSAKKWTAQYNRQRNQVGSSW
jgi:hypothetical protein